MKKYLKFAKNRAGFTLLEVLLVAIIVGVLAALVVPQFGGFIEKARVAEATGVIGAIKTAELAYKLNAGNYVACANEAAINTNLAVSIPIPAAPLWHYAVTAPSATQFIITATRQNNPVGIPWNTNTIVFTWNDATGGVWSGTHPYRPQ